MDPTPRTELTHPWGTGLDDFEPHVRLVPVAVGAADEILGLKVGRLDISQRHPLVTAGEDAVEMRLHHAGELVVGGEPTPLEVIDPTVEEAPCAGLRLVGPQVVERLFEQMPFEQLAADAQQVVERLPGLAAHVGLPGKQDELLAGQKPLEATSCLAQFRLPDLVERVEQVPDDVELVVDDLDAGAVNLEAIAVGLPHVHNGVGDEPRARLAEPLPELAQILLPAAADHVEQLRTPRTLQGADHAPVGLSLAHRDLIDAQDRHAVERPLGLGLLQRPLVDGLDRGPMQPHQRSRSLDGHDLVQLVDQDGQRTCDHGAVRCERQRLQAQAALRATDPEAAHAPERRMLPQRQMLDLDPPARMRAADGSSALAASMRPSKTCELQDNGPLPASWFDRQLGDAVPWKSQKCSETMKAHRVGPPACPLTREQREYTLLDASFSGGAFHKNLS